MTESTRTQPAPASSNDPKTSAAENVDYISVDIYDQTYHLRGDDPDYIHRLADIVDAKMRAVASHGKTVDSLRVAVLAALNIADELATHRAAIQHPHRNNRRDPAPPSAPAPTRSPACSTPSSAKNARSASRLSLQQESPYPG